MRERKEEEENNLGVTQKSNVIYLYIHAKIIYQILIDKYCCIFKLVKRK